MFLLVPAHPVVPDKGRKTVVVVIVFEKIQFLSPTSNVVESADGDKLNI